MQIHFIGSRLSTGVLKLVINCEWLKNCIGINGFTLQMIKRSYCPWTEIKILWNVIFMDEKEPIVHQQASHYVLASVTQNIV